MLHTLLTLFSKTTGLKVSRARLAPADLDAEATEIIRRIRPFSLTSPERAFAVVQAVRYLVAADIRGALVECGVWRGGSMMAAAMTLMKGGTSRELYLFDTYEGMPEPTSADRDRRGAPAMAKFLRTRSGTTGSDWCRASIDDVQTNMRSTGYNAGQIHLVKGKVQDTIPQHAPQEIAMLRLDTDWYESTLHELQHLYPRLVPGGVLLLDDYGHWEGSRRATDEYFASHGINILLTRVDGTGRVAIKPR